MTLAARARAIRQLDRSVPPGSVYASERRAVLDRRRTTVQRLAGTNTWKQSVR